MKGFTLVEVLVALGMVSVALAAGLSLSGSLVQRAERAPELLRAELCARNRLAALRLARELPPAGETQTPCVQADSELQVLSTVTVVGDFRQVQVQVRSTARAGAVVLSLATVLGRY